MVLIAKFKQHKRTILVTGGCCLVLFIFSCLMLLPLWDNRSSLDIISDIVRGVERQVDVGDEPSEEPEAYNYWYAPENSFGASESKDVNMSYWKPWLRSMFYWDLKASPNNITWYDANELLTINIDWDETNITGKVTLILDTTDAPQDLYYKFILACNASLKQFINKSSWYEYELTLPANGTDDYTIFFNFSDVKPLIQSGKVWVDHGKKTIGEDDYFWFKVQTVNKISPGVVFVVDPTFGADPGGTYSSTTSIADSVKAGYFQMASVPGEANSITAKITRTAGSPQVRCILYDSDKNFVANGETEEKMFYFDRWETFDFEGTKPILEPNAWYYIAGWADTSCTVYYASSGGDGVFYDSHTYNGIPDPFAGSTTDANGICAIYCDYTVTNIAPSFEGAIPTNNSYNQSINPTINITVNDGDGENLNCTFYTSKDGSSWTHRQNNNTVTANTSISYTWTTASDYQTTYYWKITANDTTANTTSEFYNFETTPYRTLYFNDTFPNENWINSSNNMTHESGWENFTYGEGGSYSHNGDFNDGAEDALIVTEDGFYHDDSDDEGWYYGANTPSSNTGADSPYEGAKMLYIESSADHYNFDNYLDYPITLTSGTNVTVEFQYHMYGAHIAWLAVQVVDSNGVAEDIWNLSGQQQTADSDPFRKGIAGIDDGSSYPYTGSYEIRFHGKAGASYYGDICIDWIWINQTNASINDAFIISDELFIPDTVTYDWDEFYAYVNDTVSCSFALVDPDDTDHNITSGLTGNGDDISSVTNDSVMIFGNFSDNSVNMGSWNITWTSAAVLTWNQIDTTIYGNYTNLTSFYSVDTVYGNYSNTTEYKQINTIIYGNYTNTTTYYQIDTIIYGNYTNTTGFYNVDTIYGNYTNITITVWNQIDTTIYGNYSNTTVFYSVDTIYGNYTNTTSFYQIDLVYGNYSNITAFYNVDLVYGNYSNTTIYYLTDTVYGNYTNITILTWNQIDIIYGNYSNTTVFYQIDMIYGNYSNITTYRLIDTIYGNYTNTTTHRLIDTIFGNYTNITVFYQIDMVYGNYTNITLLVWNQIDTTVYGNYSNTTIFNQLDTVYGNYSNTTGFYQIDTTIFGNYTNTTAFYQVDTIFGNYTNSTTHRLIDTVFGNYTNTTTYHQINTVIYGNYTNITTLVWNQIDTTIYGNYTNTTTYHQIDTVIYGNYTNTTGFYNVDTVYGNYTNTTSFFQIDIVYGNYTNTTGFYSVDTVYGNYTNVTITVWNQIDTNIYGNYTNITLVWNNIDTVYGNYTNVIPPAVLTITNVNPVNGSSIPYTIPVLYFNITSLNGLDMNYTIRWSLNLDLDEILTNTTTAQSNGTHYHAFSNASSRTTYYWSINLTDSNNNWQNETYHYTSNHGPPTILDQPERNPIIYIGIILLILIPILFLLIIKKRQKGGTKNEF